jgi:hypothetical protein
MAYTKISIPPLKYLFAFAAAYAKLQDRQVQGVLPSFNIPFSQTQREAHDILASSFQGFAPMTAQL